MAAGSETFDIRTWLYGVLSGDAALVALVGAGGIHANQLPQVQIYPCLLFSLQSGVDINSLGERGLVNQLWQIQAINVGESSAALGPAMARIDVLLQEVIATSGGGLRLRWRREQTLEYPETQNGIRYNHVGAMYRCFAS